MKTKKRLSLGGILAVFLLSLTVIVPVATVGATGSQDVVPGGCNSIEAVLEALGSNERLRTALWSIGVDPDKVVSVEKVVAQERVETLSIDSEGRPFHGGIFIEPGEEVFELTLESGQIIWVKDICCNPTVAPLTAFEVRKLCCSNDNCWPCGQVKALRIEFKGLYYGGQPVEFWFFPTSDWDGVWKGIFPEWLVELIGPDGAEATFSEDPIHPYQPSPADSCWQVLLVRPGETVTVIFRNVGPKPAESPEPTPSPPGPTPTESPQPTPKPTGSPEPTPSPPEPTPGPTETPGPTPEPTPEPTAKVHGNNGIGQEKRGLEDPQPPGLEDKPGLDNDRKGRTDSDPGTPTDENQSRGGNRGETPAEQNRREGHHKR